MAEEHILPLVKLPFAPRIRPLPFGFAKLVVFEINASTQESYFTYGSEEESPVNHDIHFRAGIAPDGSDTFTPRTLIYDLKGSFGSMRRINALYEAEDDINVDVGRSWFMTLYCKISDEKSWRRNPESQLSPY